MNRKNVVMVMALSVFIGAVGPQAASLAADDEALTADEATIAARIRALHDANSETRVAAADVLRRIVAKYPSDTVYLSSKDGGAAAWQEKVNQIKPGLPKAEVHKILPPFAEAPDGIEMGSGDSHVVNYRLDYHWTVTVSYRNPDKVIEQPKLYRQAFKVFVAPPKDFTGAWITWHVNGQKGHEIQYKNGKYDGAFTAYHDNGAKNFEQHYSNHVAHGADTGWHRNGKTSYTGQYLNDKQDGKWAHWYANGQKKCETNYDKGELNGQEAHWYENGQMSSVRTYKDGVKHGYEASWNERGVLNYDRKYANGEVVER
jgi:antitoxin component YwqK of YwqJK toxin-antitoxin module